LTATWINNNEPRESNKEVMSRVQLGEEGEKHVVRTTTFTKGKK